MMEKYIFTDLACENFNDKIYTKTRLSTNIERTEGKDKENRNYITYFTPRLWMLKDEDYFLLENAISSDIRTFTNLSDVRNTKCRRSVLIVGMGNPYFCSDSLGVESARKIIATRHINDNTKYADVSVIIPDVTGNTGIETADAVEAYVSSVSPDAIIIIDSLAARSSVRLASTVQLTNDGIVPGGGIGAGHKKISQKELGVPILSIGVPTVINTSTLIYDAVKKVRYGEIKDDILGKILSDTQGMFVAPKESDLLIRTASMLLSTAINNALS